MIRYITELPSSEWENSFPRPVVLLGSTGSIGVNTLRIIEKHPDLFQVVALAGGRNVERLIEQAVAAAEKDDDSFDRLLRCLGDADMLDEFDTEAAGEMVEERMLTGLVDGAVREGRRVAARREKRK